MFRTKCKEHDHSSFYQLLQMEHNKIADCYFYYYSTCKKGDNCLFRHEPTALGCESMCVYWKQGKCFQEHCNFRHMELKKNRKSIPCYWEMKPGGCRKPHCSFMHKNARTFFGEQSNPVNNSDLTTKSLAKKWANSSQESIKYEGSSIESDNGTGSSEAGSCIGSPAVDPLIVKFEEESDNESVPSPVKPQPRVPYCKTYEEIRLEEIQAESAAYYSYETEDRDAEDNLGKRASKIIRENSKDMDFEILTLEEIRRRKRRKAFEEKGKETSRVAEEEENSANEFLKEAMKTLAELRGAKRTFNDDRSKVKSDTDRSSNAPPVKLRRCSKRIDPGIDSPRKVLETDACFDKIDDVRRRNDVEIRLCDSSTDENERSKERTSANYAADEPKETILSCDSLLNMNEDEYLTLDMASEDILKDIDALLKEKTSV